MKLFLCSSSHFWF